METTTTAHDPVLTEDVTTSGTGSSVVAGAIGGGAVLLGYLAIRWAWDKLSGNTEEADATAATARELQSRWMQGVNAQVEKAEKAASDAQAAVEKSIEDLQANVEAYNTLDIKLRDLIDELTEDEEKIKDVKTAEKLRETANEVPDSTPEKKNGVKEPRKIKVSAKHLRAVEGIEWGEVDLERAAKIDFSRIIRFEVPMKELREAAKAFGEPRPSGSSKEELTVKVLAASTQHGLLDPPPKLVPKN